MYRAMGHPPEDKHEYVVQAMAQALTNMLTKTDAKSLDEWFADPSHWLNLSLSDNGKIIAISAVSKDD